MVDLLIAAVVAAVAIGAYVSQRGTVRVLRTELNHARSSEQLLLTRLASRSPAEFHAVAATYGLTDSRPAPAAPPKRVLTDPTGLIQFEDDEEPTDG